MFFDIPRMQLRCVNPNFSKLFDKIIMLSVDFRVKQTVWFLIPFPLHHSFNPIKLTNLQIKSNERANKTANTKTVNLKIKSPYEKSHAIWTISIHILMQCLTLPSSKTKHHPSKNHTRTRTQTDLISILSLNYLFDPSFPFSDFFSLSGFW